MTDTFVTLIERGAPLAEVSGHLDSLDPDTRVVEVRATPGRLHRTLWSMTAGESVKLVDFAGPMDKTIIYAGRNSLPIFTLFEKRFWRSSKGGGVVGYNHQSMSTFTGPGYFTALDGENGELVFDYTKLPGAAPAGWPAVRPNTGLLAGAVYGGMIDYNRRLSRDTVIGSATKHGKAQGQFYLLTRAP